MSDPTLPESTEDSGLTRFHSGGWCPACEREWTSLTEAHCPSCCAHFTSDNAFDRHLAPVASAEPCHDPIGILDKHKRKVFEQIQRAHGPVWRIRDSRPHPFARIDSGAGEEGPIEGSRDSDTPEPIKVPENADPKSEALVELKNEIRGMVE